MPIYEIECLDCGYQGETIHPDHSSNPECPSCGTKNTRKLMSATSGLTGRTAMAYPGPSDTACCGSTPSKAGCAGPGSCCGKSFG